MNTTTTEKSDQDGLTEQQARERLAQYGHNELPSEEKKGIYRVLVEVIREPMFILLIGCAVLYMLLGNTREGFVLLSTILIIIFISFVLIFILNITI